MSYSKKIIVEISYVYRLWHISTSEGLLYALEAQSNDGLKITREWDDTGHVANILVKQGVAPDHKSALELLKS